MKTSKWQPAGDFCSRGTENKKKKRLERVEVTGKHLTEFMNKMFTNMERLTNSIADGFGLWDK